MLLKYPDKLRHTKWNWTLVKFDQMYQYLQAICGQHGCREKFGIFGGQAS